MIQWTGDVFESLSAFGGGALKKAVFYWQALPDSLPIAAWVRGWPQPPGQTAAISHLLLMPLGVACSLAWEAQWVLEQCCRAHLWIIGLPGVCMWSVGLNKCQ